MVPEHAWLHQPVKTKGKAGKERNVQAESRRDPRIRKS
jgi:hypothetical protein